MEAIMTNAELISLVLSIIGTIAAAIAIILSLKKQKH
jgi:hypothetical protein